MLRHFGRECYSKPQDVYETARRRGMDLVTLTDHDSIAGALELAGRPDTFVSEEVTVLLPGDRQLHVGVLDITEAQHERISVLRKDAEALFAYLAEERIPAVINHLFSALTGDRATEDFGVALRSGIPLIEGRNGMVNERTNTFARQAGAAAEIPSIGGSDAHTLASVASAYSIVEGATNRAEFLAGLRRGCVIPAGEHGTYAKLTRDVVRIFAGGYREAAATLLDGPGAVFRFGVLVLALPLMPLIPAVTGMIYAHEQFFAGYHHRLYRSRVHPVIRQNPWRPASSAVQS